MNIASAYTFSIALALVMSASHAQSSEDPPEPRTPFPRDPFPAPRIPLRPPVRIYFPPDPPPLAGAIRSGPSWAPAELASYVNETFYPSLGTRLATKKLSNRLRARLEQYRSTKLELQNELTAELHRLRDLEPAARIPELTALRARQTPRLVELEATAEQLRRDLTSSSETWDAQREWSLRDRVRRGYSPNEVAQVMRASAYYAAGLSLVQRGLLREIAIELGTPADSTAHAIVAQPYLFFSPEPARVLLPDDLPDDVTSKIAMYQTEKSALKKELYDVIHASDGKQFGFLGNLLKALARKQAARLANLESLAEEIRHGLADLAKPNAILERSPVPATLHARMNHVVAGYLAAQNEAAARIDIILAAAKDLPMRVNYRFDGERLRFGFEPRQVHSTARSVQRGGGTGADHAGRMEAVRGEVAAVAEDYYRRMSELIKEKEAIQTAIEAALGVSAEDRFEHALRAAQGKGPEDSYRDYRIAVFQPGLSPEQRRLLFDSAIEGLDLQLPNGELQPRNRRRAQ